MNAVQALLPVELHQEIFDYINRHNEWGLGVEILIEYLIEHDIEMTTDQFKTIKQALISMKLSDYDMLRHLRVSS